MAVQSLSVGDNRRVRLRAEWVFKLEQLSLLVPNSSTGRCDAAGGQGRIERKCRVDTGRWILIRAEEPRSCTSSARLQVEGLVEWLNWTRRPP